MVVQADHDLLLSLGEELPVGIWVARASNGELIYANRMFSEMFGIAARELIHMEGFAQRHGMYSRGGDAHYPEHKLPFVRALTECRVIVADDITVRRQDGAQLEVRAVSRPVGNPITHVVTTLFDITREVAAERARSESEQRLRRAQRLEAIGTLAGGIAHDFNNLIFGIKLIAAEAAANEQDPKRRAAMELIDDITDRSATLTRSLLGFVRRNKSRPMPVGLNDVVTSMSELLTRTLAGIDVELELEASDRGTVIADQSQLEQIVMTLVLHARDAVAGSGRIIVRTTDRGTASDARFVLLEVKDNGTGVSADSPASSLEAQGAPSEEHGTAMSLPSVFAVVEGYGGSIEIDEGIDGRGTTMRVVLPAASRAAAVRPRSVAADLPRGSGTILVVDDDHMVRKVLVSSLTALGYQPLEATSGTDAVELYRTHRDQVRAVVLDMVMPGMTGKATYLALREVDPAVAVLLMSGHTLNEQVQEILDLGVRNFVSKPYSIAVLARAMAELTQ